MTDDNNDKDADDGLTYMMKVARTKPPKEVKVTETTFPRNLLEELEILIVELGEAPPHGDYDVDAKLNEKEVQHAESISKAYGDIQVLIKGLITSGDDDAVNALSESGFMHEFANIRPERCNQFTSQALLKCTAKIKKR